MDAGVSVADVNPSAFIISALTRRTWQQVRLHLPAAGKILQSVLVLALCSVWSMWTWHWHSEALSCYHNSAHWFILLHCRTSKITAAQTHSLDLNLHTSPSNPAYNFMLLSDKMLSRGGKNCSKTQNPRGLSWNGVQPGGLECISSVTQNTSSNIENWIEWSNWRQQIQITTWAKSARTTDFPISQSVIQPWKGAFHRSTQKTTARNRNEQLLTAPYLCSVNSKQTPMK